MNGWKGSRWRIASSRDAGRSASCRYIWICLLRSCVSSCQADTGVFFAPGSCFGVEGHLRLGLGINNTVMREGLSRLSRWLHQKS